MEAPPGRRPCGVRPRICLCISAVLGIILLALGGAVRAEQQRFTPIYQNVTCKPVAVNLRDVSRTPLGFSLQVDVACRNPNPYSLSVAPAAARGRVALGSARREVSMVDVGATTIRPGEGGQPSESIVVLRSSVRLTLLSTLTIASSLLQGPFKVYFELKMDVSVDPAVLLFLKPFSIQLPVEEACGMEVMLVPSQQAGEAVCGESFAALAVPPLDQALSEDSPGLTPAVDPVMLEESAESRDAVCVPVFAACFSLGGALVLLSVGWCVLLATMARGQKGKQSCVEPVVLGVPA